MSDWAPSDIAWGSFDIGRVDSDLLKLVKAASMVERNAPHYADYLFHVFHDNEAIQSLAKEWADAEMQHGETLASWAKMADPDFDFDARFKRYTDGFHIPTEVTKSIRGSLTGELLARCVVETGTSSYYTAIRRGTTEPVLHDLCTRIAADELRHYKTFYELSRQYLEKEGISLMDRIRVVAGRVIESNDDELAYAYHAANENKGRFNRARSNGAYVRRAYRLYPLDLVERIGAMLLKIVGLRPRGRLNRVMARCGYRFLQWRSNRYAAKGY